jgi:hypothetical protein
MVDAMSATGAESKLKWLEVQFRFILKFLLMRIPKFTFLKPLGYTQFFIGQRGVAHH